MSPFELGGEMIRKVPLERTTWADLPYKFEAGTPPIAEAFGLGAAIDYLNDVGLEAIEQHEHELTEYALGRLGELPYVARLRASAGARRGGIVSFEVDGVHPHDVAQILDWRGRRRARRPPLHAADHGRTRRRAPRPGRASTSTRCPRRSTGSSRGSPAFRRTFA